MYTCRSHTIVVFKQGRVIFIPLGCGRVCGPDACLWCWEKRANKLRTQLERELYRSELIFAEVSEGDFKSVKRNLVQHKTMHKSYPQEGGTTLFAFDADNKLWFSGELLTLDNLQDVALKAAKTPKKKRVGGTRTTANRSGFGIVESINNEDSDEDNDDTGKSCIVALDNRQMHEYIEKLRDAGTIRKFDLLMFGEGDNDAVHTIYANDDVQGIFETMLRHDLLIISKAEEQVDFSLLPESIDVAAWLDELRR